MKTLRPVRIILLTLACAVLALACLIPGTAGGAAPETHTPDDGMPRVRLPYSFGNSVPAEIRLWICEHDGCCYLFLPSGFTNGELAWNLEGVSHMELNGSPVGHGEPLPASDADYEMRFSSETVSFDGTLRVMQSAQLRSVFVHTDNQDSERLSWHPTIELTGSMMLVSADGGKIHTDRFASLHSRGNTTFDKPDKKSFHMELAHKADLLNGGRAKKYILLANDLDPSLIRNAAAFDLAESLRVPYAVKHDFTDLYIDGVYAGNYLLCEKVEIGANRIPIRNLEKETKALNPGYETAEYETFSMQEGSLLELKGKSIPRDPVDVSGGYLLELEIPLRYIPETGGFVTSRLQPVVVKSPDEPSVREVSYIGGLFQEMEDAVYAPDGIHPETGTHFSDYLDVDSFARHYLIEEICKNYDAFYTSQYLFKPENSYSTRIFAGPSWDFDNAICSRELTRDGFDLTSPEGLYAGAETSEVNLWHALYAHDMFLARVRDVYVSEGYGVLTDLVNRRIPEMLGRIGPSVLMNTVRWNKFDDAGITDRQRAYADETEEVRLFLEQRAEFLLREWSE